MTGYTIRPATLEDRDAIVTLAWHFAQSGIFDAWLGAATEASVVTITEAMLATGDQACIAVAVDDAGGVFGVIALLELPNLISGERYADELVWWVEPEHRDCLAGPALLTYAEDWARMRGVRFIKMVAPHRSTVGRFYARAGYRPVETVYAKVLM